MASPFRPVSKLLNRWSREQVAALTLMGKGKTPWSRLGGVSYSDRIDAKFLLLMFAPFIPIIIASETGGGRGLLWDIWMWFSVFWALVIFAVNISAYVKAIRRYDRNREVR